MLGRLVCFLALALSLGSSLLAEAAAPQVRPEPLKGVIVGGSLLTCLVDDPLVEVYVHPLHKKVGVEGRSCSISRWSPVRWHVGHGAFWVSGDWRMRGRGHSGAVLFRYDLPSLLKLKPADYPGVLPSRGTFFAQDTWA